MIKTFMEESINRLLLDKHFKQWLDEQHLRDGDVVLINNSFVFREGVRTAKNDLYIYVPVGEDGQLSHHPGILRGPKINSNFKAIASKSSNISDMITLDSGVKKESSALGAFVFILISLIDDTVKNECELNHSAIDRVVWDPTKKEISNVVGKTVFIKDTYDEEAVWSAVEDYYSKQNAFPPDGLKEALGVALDKLQDEAVANLHLPKKSGSSDGGMTDCIIDVLMDQRSQYKAALDRCKGDPERDAGAFNELLRIAYNFSSDATTYLRLIVSICDLKPIVLWGTIYEHYQLSEAFRLLPWARSRNKPSLKNYIDTIADARNSSFHNLFPFRKSLNFRLPISALEDANLRIFSEHGKKKDNQLHYQDQELVDVLLEFTRARERRVTSRFWKQNLEVMDATIKLFANTAAFLKALYRAKD